MRCCDAGAYEEMFDAGTARADADRYRRRGLDPQGRRLVAALAAERLRGADVLEVGGGVGALGIELLGAGAARVVNVELSPAYEDEARALLRERGLEGRVERRVADAALGGLPPADVVVLHKVVCCYPHAAALVGASAASARRALALTFPRDSWWVRAAVAAIDVVLAVRRRAYRAYAHPAPLVLGAAAGMRVTHDAQDLVWRSVVLER